MQVSNEAELIRKLWHERMMHYRNRMGGMDLTDDEGTTAEAKLWLSAYKICRDTLDGIYAELERRNTPA